MDGCYCTWVVCYDSLLLLLKLLKLLLMYVDAAVKKSVTMERQEEILSKHIAIGEAQ